jgi:hypothetical protein
MYCALHSVSVTITENVRMLGEHEFLFFLCASKDLESALDYRVTTASPQVFFGLLCFQVRSHTITNCQVPIPCLLV